MDSAQTGDGKTKSPTLDDHIRVSSRAAATAKALAEQYGTSPGAVAEAGMKIIEHHLLHTDVIQIPELICAISDLRESVAMLVIQGEELERLGVELMALEMVPNRDEQPS